MEQTSVQKIAKILKLLVTITFVCNLIALLLVPLLVGMRQLGALVQASAWEELAAKAMWLYGFATPKETVLSVFMLFCGSCTAVVLWQGRRVLGTILRGVPFAAENAISLKRAAICAFLIAGAALLRLIWNFFYVGSLLPLTSYNALFVPIFAMAGLLALVMSALFRQAAELKAEHDLTI